eukprot:TRINITY_DN1646_c0_g1_i2.p1 TRINITY_DN1646_c0_g1~~TRINITY_DN1646_c0_g1_i2.p1  ORF type:complete len:1429 (-),score=273.51 TRINITY_DN1646_c0_g1_i2:327-4613(-)
MGLRQTLLLQCCFVAYALESFQQVHSTCCAYLVVNTATGIGQCSGDPKFGGECSSIDFSGASVYSTEYAFLAFNKAAGSGECWGDPYHGGDCSQIDFRGVTKIYATFGAFLALDEDRGVGQCWGAAYAGGNCSGVDFSGVSEVHVNRLAFLALRRQSGDGQCWGDSDHGGNCSSINFTGVTDVHANKYGRAFVALDKTQGIGQCWGSPVSGNCSSVNFTGVTEVYSNNEAFVAVDHNTGAGQCWGDNFHGGDCSLVDFTNVGQVYATYGAFLAMDNSSSFAQCWGDSNFGGDCSEIDFTDVNHIYPTSFAFLAFGDDKSGRGSASGQCSGHSEYCRSLMDSIDFGEASQMFFSYSSLMALDEDTAAGHCWELFPKYIGTNCSVLDFQLLLEEAPAPVPTLLPTPAPTAAPPTPLPTTIYYEDVNLSAMDYVEFYFDLDYYATNLTAFKEELRQDYIDLGRFSKAEVESLVILLRPGSIIAMTYGTRKTVEKLKVFVEEDLKDIKIFGAVAKPLASAFKVVPEWVIGGWTICSNRCGEGVQTRSVVCSYDDTLVPGDVACGGLVKPYSMRPCERLDGCESTVFCPLGAGHDVSCDTQSALVFTMFMAPATCALTLLLRYCYLHREGLHRCAAILFLLPPPNPKAQDLPAVDTDAANASVAGRAEDREGVPGAGVWPDDGVSVRQAIREDGADRGVPRPAIAADGEDIVEIEMPGNFGTYSDDLEPAFELGAVVEYYSQTDDCWLHANVADIREGVDNESGGQVCLEYDIVTLTGAVHHSVARDTLRLRLEAEEPCAVFSPTEDRWLDSWVHGQQATPTFTSAQATDADASAACYTARTAGAGLVMAGLPRTYVRRRFPEGALVRAYCGEATGWMKGTVVSEEEGWFPGSSVRAAGEAVPSSPGSANIHAAGPAMARWTLVTVELENDIGTRQIASFDLKFQAEYLEYLRRVSLEEERPISPGGFTGGRVTKSNLPICQSFAAEAHAREDMPGVFPEGFKYPSIAKAMAKSMAAIRGGAAASSGSRRGRAGASRSSSPGDTRRYHPPPDDLPPDNHQEAVEKLHAEEEETRRAEEAARRDEEAAEARRRADEAAAKALAEYEARRSYDQAVARALAEEEAIKKAQEDAIERTSAEQRATEAARLRAQNRARQNEEEEAARLKAEEDTLRRREAAAAQLRSAQQAAASQGDEAVLEDNPDEYEAEQTAWLREIDIEITEDVAADVEVVPAVELLSHEMLGGSRGVATFSDGSKYEGQFSGQRKHGRGKYTYPDGYVYDGTWVEDAQDGFGRETLADGSKYEGQFRAGEKSGIGKFTFSTGGFYNGAFSGDLMQGHGCYTWEDGRSYTGPWNRNLMDGEGMMVWRDGRKYIGQFVQGQFGEGIGRMEWPNGRSFEGTWRSGKQHGFGVATTAAGTKYNTEWDDGTYIRSLEE